MGYLKRHAGEKRTWIETAGVLVVSGVLAGFMLVQAIRSTSIAKREERDHDVRLQEARVKEAERIDLEQKLKKFESGEGLEMEARSRLNLQRPDEHVLIVLDDKKQTPTTTESKSPSFWTWVRGLFSW